VKGCLIIKKTDYVVNEKIVESEVRLINSDGSMLGVISCKEALSLAMLQELDLVRIPSDVVPPVCKIMNYGQFAFEQSKKEKEARKNQKTVSTKEVQVSPTIESHDLEFKVRNIVGFLKDGSKVKVSMRFKGREMQYASAGTETLIGIARTVSDVGTIDKQPKLEGKNMIMFLTPKK